jgi:hypothetical protein
MKVKQNTENKQKYNKYRAKSDKRRQLFADFRILDIQVP